MSEENRTPTAVEVVKEALAAGPTEVLFRKQLGMANLGDWNVVTFNRKDVARLLSEFDSLRAIAAMQEKKA